MLVISPDPFREKEQAGASKLRHIAPVGKSLVRRRRPGQGSLTPGISQVRLVKWGKWVSRGQPGAHIYTHVGTNRHQADIAPYHIPRANCKQVNLTVIYTVNRQQD